MKLFKRLVVFALSFAMILSVLGTNAAAKKKASLNKKSLTIYTGKTATLKFKNLSKVQKKKKATWKSSAKKVVKVKAKGKSSAKLTALKKGKAKITAKLAGKKYVCKITVKALPGSKSDTPAASSATKAPATKATAEPNKTATPAPSDNPTAEPTATVEPTATAEPTPTLMPTSVPVANPTADPEAPARVDGDILAKIGRDEGVESVDVFYGQDYTKEPDEKNVVFTYPRSKADPSVTDFSGEGQINIRVNLKPDYAIEEVTATSGAYKNIKSSGTDEDIPENVYRLTKISADIDISIVTKSLKDFPVAPPLFSKDAGNYSDPFDLTLSAGEKMTILYSTDGTDPTPERFNEQLLSGKEITIHSYTEPIKVKDRTGEPNVLATKENTKAMTQEGHISDDAYLDNTSYRKATVIKACAVDSNGKTSDMVSKTYFVGSNLSTSIADVPVISMVTDPRNLLDDEIGIFVVGKHENYNQHGKDWERATAMEFFNKSGKVDFSTNVGIRTHGGYTRGYTQKSLNVYFREEYSGQKAMEYEFIPGNKSIDGTPMNTYKNIMLRNGGNDTDLTKFADGFVQGLVKDRNIATQGYQPVLLYLNGEFWGAYNIRDKYSDQWLADKYGINKNEAIIIKEGEVDEGQSTDIEYWNQLKALAELDMTKVENYKKFLDMVDIKSYMDYYGIELYIGNNDWGMEKNNQCWRTRSDDSENPYADGKFRWLLHDTEFSFALYNSQLDLVVPEGGGKYKDGFSGADPLFAAVFKNPNFATAFATNLKGLMADELSYSKHSKEYDEMAKIYKPLCLETNIRFLSNWYAHDLTCFDSRVKGFKDFWSKRDAQVNEWINKFCPIDGNTKE